MNGCDLCIARATHRACLTSGATLEFCDHHVREQGDRLKAAGATIMPIEPAVATAAV